MWKQVSLDLDIAVHNSCFLLNQNFWKFSELGEKEQK